MADDAGETGTGRYVGFVPGRVLVDLIMGVWGGFFCLLVVDLVSRFAGLPIPGNVVSIMSQRKLVGRPTTFLYKSCSCTNLASQEIILLILREKIR